MATEKLFGNKIKPACAYCTQVFRDERQGGYICARSGSVSPEHFCRRFEYDPLKRIPRRPLPLGSYNNADFAL